jgi:hypothetical protein
MAKLMAAAVLSAALILGACGGGGGGGDGVTYDNSRAGGTFTYVQLDGTSVAIGTCTFDGAGGGTYTEDSPAGPGGSFTYTTTTNNIITIDNTTVGTLRAGGDFFAATDTTNGGMMFAVKQSTQVTDTAANYVAGVLSYDGGSGAEIDGISIATPGAGQLTWETLRPVSSASGTESYTLNTSNGTVSSPDATPYQYGAFSSSLDLFLLGDGETTVTNNVFAMLGLKLSGSGMSNASLSGTYIVHQLIDGDVGAGGSFVVTRGRITFDGNGSGTYQELATSSTPDTTPIALTYSVNADGTCTIDPGGGVQFEGAVLADGSVLSLVDYDSGDNEVFILVGVKQ